MVTSRACLCRCAFVLRSHVGRVVFTSLHDGGVSKRLKHPPLALVRELLVQLQPGTSLKTDGSRAPRLRGRHHASHTFNPNSRLMLILPRRRTYRRPFRRRRRSVTRLAVGLPTSRMVTSIRIQCSSHRSSRSVPVRDSRLLRSLWEPVLLSSLLCASDMRQISTSVPVHFKYLSQTPSHRTVQPLVFPRVVLRAIAG